MPEKRLHPKRNAYRFRGTSIDVIAELPQAAQACIRRGGDVIVTVEWREPGDPS